MWTARSDCFSKRKVNSSLWSTGIASALIKWEPKRKVSFTLRTLYRQTIRGGAFTHRKNRYEINVRVAFGTQVRGFKPSRSRRIFQGENILSAPSFGGEVKPLVPCRRFTACKRLLNVTWKSGISGKIHRLFLAHIVPPLATRISGETTSGESWNV